MRPTGWKQIKVCARRERTGWVFILPQVLYHHLRFYYLLSLIANFAALFVWQMACGDLCCA